jgi:predicted phage terminase large subunit-like protein
MSQAAKVYRPQKGPQEQFLATPADIAIYGGAAGGGKSAGLLLETTRNLGNRDFGAVLFRRTTPQIKNEGGLWDESHKFFLDLGGEPRSHVLQWKFPSGAKVTMSHLEHDKTVLNYQGAQIPLIGFDELTHFSAKQFWYMVSRNRSMCGVKPYIRATTNPDADSWVAQFIEWWIDQSTGLPIPERSGVLRWFVRLGDVIQWASDPKELEQYKDNEGNPIPAKSATFIAASLTDNKILMRADPGYMASLMALPTVERERLLGGNWKIRPAAGLYFQGSWCEIVDAAPSGLTRVRGWDFAATRKTETNDPDWTAGTLIGKSTDKTYYILDHVKDRIGPMEVKRLILNTASRDGIDVEIRIPQDPGSAGKAQVLDLTKMLSGYNVRSGPVTGDKITRFTGFSAQAEAGNVKIVRGRWNADYIQTLEGFPEAAHDDDVDSTSEAFNALIDTAYDWMAFT